MKAVVLIPTYNEKENIARIVPALEEVFSECPNNFAMHILVVDDSSPDGTANVVKAMQKKYSNLHVLINPKKGGLGAAYLKGMDQAFNHRQADLIFEFDADFSHDPKKLPSFLHKINEGYDFVLGSRYIKGGSIPSNWGLHRKFLSVFGNLFINIVLTTLAIRDWTTGYRAITKKVYEAVSKEMNSERFSGYTFQIGFLHKAFRKGFKVAEVPFHFTDRTSGHSKLGAEYVKNTLLYIVKVRALEISSARMFKFGVVGGIGFVINTVGLFIFQHLPFLPPLSEQLRNSTHLLFLNTSGLASMMGAECAIVSNFMLNNFWTFKDRKPVSALALIPKFVQFNLSSLGALAMQLFIVGTGTHYTGTSVLSKFSWLVIATAIGMCLNYFVYSRVIWRTRAKA